MVYLCLPFVLALGSPAVAQKAQPTTIETTQSPLADQLAEAKDLEQKARYERDIADIRSDLLANQTNWFEILTSVMIGLLGSLITVIVLNLVWRLDKTAKAEIAAARKEMDAQVQEARVLLEDAKAKILQIEAHRRKAETILSKLKGGEAPSDPQTREQVLELADTAAAKPSEDRTIADYRALVVQAAIQEDWASMAQRASKMSDLLLDDSNESDAMFALFNEAYALGKLGESEKSIAKYDDILRRFEGNANPEIAQQIVKAMINKAIRLAILDRLDEAISTYNDVLSRFSDNHRPEITELVAKAMVNKAADLSKIGLSEDAIAISDDIIDRFGNNDLPELKRQLAKALANKAVNLEKCNRYDEAIATSDQVMQRFGNDEKLKSMPEVAMALMCKAICLGKCNKVEQAISVYDEVVGRFSKIDKPEIVEQVAAALFNKACTFALAKNVKGAVENLELWVETNGKMDCGAVNNDKDFDAVRSRKAFVDFMKRHGCN